MKKRILALALALVMCLGLAVVPAMAAETEETEDMAVVEAIPCEHYWAIGEPPAFHEGLAHIGAEAGYGFMDKTGEIVIPYQYEGAGDFSEGLAAVMLDGKWGFIDKSGELVIPCQYEATTNFSEGLAGVKQNGKCGFIDKTGKEVIPCIYSNTSTFCEGLAGIEVGGKWGFIDKTGEEVIPCRYDGGRNFSEGLTVVAIGGKYGFIDQTGKEIIPCTYSYADSFSEGLAVIERNGKCGFIDKTGKEVIPCKYVNAGAFSSGLAPVKEGNKWGYINKAGEVAIPFQYNGANSFSEGYASVWKEDTKKDLIACGYIDKTGKEVVPFVFTSPTAPGRYVDTYDVSDGMAAVVRLEPIPGGGYFSTYGYLAFPTVEEPGTAAPEPVEVTAEVSGWAKELVSSAAAAGLIADGLGEDYTKNITRAQFAAVSVKLYEAMSGQAAPAAGDSPFTDTSDPAVIQAADLGFVGGVGGGKFAPDEPVTREQAAVMLSRVYTKLGGEIPAVDATGFADDGEMSAYARSAVAFMADKEIVNGVGDGKFAPQGSASIEAALIIALKMFENLK